MRHHSNWFWWLGGNDFLDGLGSCLFKRALQLRLIVSQRLFGLLYCDVASPDQGFNIKFAHASTLGNGFVHQRLCVTRVVTFVVSESAVTNHVDHDVFVKLLTVFKSKLRNTHARFRVVTVDVKNWCLDCFRHVTAILR